MFHNVVFEKESILSWPNQFLVDCTAGEIANGNEVPSKLSDHLVAKQEPVFHLYSVEKKNATLANCFLL